MRCMTEETFGPTLPVMRVADAEEAVALANDGPYGLQASVWTRDAERGEALARRIEAGVACVNDAQLNYARARAADGRLEGVGPRLAPRRRTGSASTRSASRCMITPGYAPSRELHYFPYSAEVTDAGRRGDRARSRPASSSTTRSGATLLAFCDTIDPVARRRREGRRRRRPARLLGARRLALGVPEAVEIALLQSGAPEEQLDGLRELLDALADEGMAAGDAAGGARGRSSTPSPTPAPRRSPGSRRCAASRCRSSTRCPTSAPAATRTGTRSATRARSAPPPDEPKPLDRPPARRRRATR